MSVFHFRRHLLSCLALCRLASFRSSPLGTQGGPGCRGYVSPLTHLVGNDLEDGLRLLQRFLLEKADDLHFGSFGSGHSFLFLIILSWCEWRGVRYG